MRSLQRHGARHHLVAFSIVVIVLFVSAGCGPQDYQKPIQGFQDASNTVITAERGFLANENTIEQDIYINQQVFEQKPLDPKLIDAQSIITPEEIKYRTDALDALSKYTVSLASLAGGKEDSTVGADTKTCSTNLETLAKDAGGKSASSQSSSGKSSSDKSSSDKKAASSGFNASFSGIAGAAAAGIGAVAQLMLDHKARTEIRASVNSSDKDVTALLDLIGVDAQDSYERQRTKLNNYGLQLFRDYDCEVSPEQAQSNSGASGQVGCRKTRGDAASLLALADRIKSWRADQATLAAANPAPAIEKMKKSHEDLVKYVNAPNAPENLQQLRNSVEAFISSAQSLGSASQQLNKTSK
jgi:hypothetical protein